MSAYHQVERLLPPVLFAIAKWERKSNEIRRYIQAESAALHYTFAEVFRIFDFEDKGYLTPDNFVAILRKYRPSFQYSDAQILTYSISGSSINQVSYTQFTYFLSTSEKQYHFYHRAKRGDAAPGKRINYPNTGKDGSHFCSMCSSGKAESAIVKLLLFELKMFKKLDALKVKMLAEPHFCLLEGFKFLDGLQEGFITHHGMRHILIETDWLITREEIYAIFHRIDKAKAGRLSLQDFLDEMKPFPFVISGQCTEANHINPHVEIHKGTPKDGNDKVIRSDTAHVKVNPQANEKHEYVNERVDPTREVLQSPANNWVPQQSKMHRNHRNKSPHLYNFRPSPSNSREEYHPSGVQNALGLESPSSGNSLLQADYLGPPEPTQQTTEGSNAYHWGQYQALNIGDQNHPFQARANHSNANKTPSPRHEKAALNLQAPKSPMNDARGKGVCEQKLHVLFGQQLFFVQQIRSVQQALSMRSDFNLVQLWNMFDPHCRGIGEVMSIRKAFDALGVVYNGLELDLFINKFSRMHDARCRYLDICDAFIPPHPVYAEKMINRIPMAFSNALRHRAGFYGRTKLLVAKLIKLQMQLELLLYRMRRSVEAKDIQNVFISADSNKNGYVTVAEFQAMLGKFGLNSSVDDTYLLLDRYTISNNCSNIGSACR